MYVEYNSNNSGGSWWLDDEDWKALEQAGWKVHWAHLENLYTDEEGYVQEEDGTPKLVPIGEGNSRFGASFSTKDENGEWRYMGSLAKCAYRVGLGLSAAASEWERVTGKSSTDAGCPCCGQPHNFTEYDDEGKYVDSGPSVDYSCSWEETEL